MSIIAIEETLAVAAGGALGAVLRFALARGVQHIIRDHVFPLGILLANILGCFVIGLVIGLFANRLVIGPVWRVMILVGLLGGFTTFSTFSLDTVMLWQSGQSGWAVLNIIASMLGCLTATACGLWLAK